MTLKTPLLFFVLSFLLIGAALTLWHIPPVQASQISASEPVQIAQSTEEAEEDELDEDDC